MKVQDVMSKEPRTCRAEESLARVATILWEQDCGVVPVVDDSGRPVGVVTDRDACMASLTQGRAVGEIPVGTAMSRQIVTCRADDSVDAALATMGERQLRRLPVVDGEGAVCGLLSISDLVRRAAAGQLDGSGVVQSLARICHPHRGTGAADASANAGAANVNANADANPKASASASATANAGANPSPTARPASSASVPSNPGLASPSAPAGGGMGAGTASGIDAQRPGGSPVVVPAPRTPPAPAAPANADKAKGKTQKDGKRK